MCASCATGKVAKGMLSVRARVWEGPLLARRQFTAGGGNYHKASFHAREPAPNGDNLIHTLVLITPGSLAP